MEKIKPKQLKQGDTIGLISTSSPYMDDSLLDRTRQTLHGWGYKTKLGKHIAKRYNYLAGTDEERAADLNAMFMDDEVDAIFSMRGGYGSARMIPLLDFQAIKENPKIFIGFSDVTSLHIAIRKQTGLITFHGPGASTFNDERLTTYTKEHVLKALTSSEAIGEIKLADENKWLHTLYPGEASGQLVGGNLTLMCASLGTPNEIDTVDNILLIEDWNEQPRKMDHMLNHLLAAGKLTDAKGIIFGESLNINPSGTQNSFTLEDILKQYITPLQIPALYGLPLGHSQDMATLPLGCDVRIQATEKRFFVEERGTV